MRSKGAAIVPILALTVFLLHPVCSRDRSFSVTTKDGARVVHNLRPAAEDPGVRLELVRQIGRLEGGSPEETFNFPIHAARDDGGNIFILDSRDGCIKKFDRDGRFLLKFGQLGQGPGELDSPAMIGIAGADRLVVFGMDSSFRIFDLEGGFISRFQVGQYEGSFMRGMASGKIVAYAMNPGREDGPENKVLNVYDLNGRVLHSFGEPLLLSTTQDTWVANYLYLTADGEDNIYAAFTSQNRIEKYSPDGRLLMTISRELPYPVEYKKVKETIEFAGRAAPVDRLEFTMVSRGIGVDSRDRIWVLSASRHAPDGIAREAYVPQDYSVFEIFDRDGILRGRVPLPEILKGFDNLVMSGDSLFFLDPYNECCVFEFKVVED